MQRVQCLTKDRFLFLPYSQKELDALVLVKGCPRACADEGLNPSGIPCRSIFGENDFETLIDWLTTLHGQGEHR